jgi:hypothetical protein
MDKKWRIRAMPGILDLVLVARRPVDYTARQDSDL